MKTIVPIILLATSIAISVFFTNKNYEQIKIVRAENVKYSEALDKSREVLEKREKLKAQYKSFNETDLAKIKKLLPDSVDNIQLLLDIQGIAEEKGMKITNTKIEEEKVSKDPSVNVSKSPYGSISLSFNTKASYDTFLDFLKKLQESLRIVDITSLAFRSNETGIYDYSITIKTYWLR